MKHLVVCGDSFMSPNNRYPNKHFIEIFCKALGFEMTSYARAGCSNGAIVIQLETALQNKPDLIIYNITNVNRVEFRVDQNRPLNHYEAFNLHNPYTVHELGDVSWATLQQSDKFYQNYSDKRIASLNLATILDEFTNSKQQDNFNKHVSELYPDWKEKCQSLRSYYKHIYDEKWEIQKQQMMLFTALYRLETKNIPCILLHDFIAFLESAYAPKWFTKKYSLHDAINKIRCNPKPLESDPGWHLSFQDSELVANILIDHYRSYF